MLKFNISDNYVKQNFSLPSPLIRYIMINTDFNNLEKLYNTCKYFYARFQINIIDNLYMDKKDNQIVYSLDLYTKQLNQLPENLLLNGDLTLTDIPNLSPLISKIVRCDLLDLYLVNTDITMNEFAILTRSETIKSICIYSKIYSSYDKNIEAPLEDIFQHLISVYYIRIMDCFVTKNTMEKLMLINFREKVTALCLQGINKMLDANLMDDFLKKNLEDKAGVQFYFKNDADNHVFLPQMFAKIDAWTPEERKPLSFPYAFIFPQ